jgi:hypothetical protein
MPSAKSWRDCIAIHPAAELFPRMSEAELRELGEDIRKNGLRESVSLLDGVLIDGRNRLDAMEAVGIRLVTANGLDWAAIPHKSVQGVDPYTFVVSKNLRRRHLTADQKRELAEKLLTATPDKSNRQIAETLKVSHVTVGAWRAELEGRGQIDHVTTRTDTRGRKQAAHKPSTTRPPSKAAVVAAADRAEALAAEEKPAPKPEPEPAPPIEAELSVEAVLDDLIALTHRNPRWVNALPMDKVYAKAELDTAIRQLDVINKTMAPRRAAKKQQAKPKPKAETLSITIAGLDLGKASAAPSREATAAAKGQDNV